MAKRYRNFKRVALKPRTAKLIVEHIVDAVFQDHFAYSPCHCRSLTPTGADWANPDCAYCYGKGEYDKCAHWCSHHDSFPVARLVEANITIGKKRARIDLPDDPKTVGLLSGELRLMLDRHEIIQDKWSARLTEEIKQLADICHRWSNRSSLDRLAEAGLELD